jgi:hypothetical protein
LRDCKNSRVTVGLHCHLPVGFRTFEALSHTCRALRHESGELPLEALHGTTAPALGDGLRHGIGKDLLFASCQTVEDSDARLAVSGHRSASSAYLKTIVDSQADWTSWTEPTTAAIQNNCRGRKHSASRTF